jgi:hypothetical protein
MTSTRMHVWTESIKVCGEETPDNITMSSKFQFVDGYKPSRANKRLIRSHAMKGKNAGKSVHRASRLSLVTKQPPRQCMLPSQAQVNLRYSVDQRDVLKRPASVLSGPGDGLLFCSLPVQFTPASLHVVSQCKPFTISLCRQKDRIALISHHSLQLCG